MYRRQSIQMLAHRLICSNSASSFFIHFRSLKPVKSASWSVFHHPNRVLRKNLFLPWLSSHNPKNETKCNGKPNSSSSAYRAKQSNVSPSASPASASAASVHVATSSRTNGPDSRAPLHLRINGRESQRFGSWRRDAGASYPGSVRARVRTRTISGTTRWVTRLISMTGRTSRDSPSSPSGVSRLGCQLLLLLVLHRGERWWSHAIRESTVEILFCIFIVYNV